MFLAKQQTRDSIAGHKPISTMNISKFINYSSMQNRYMLLVIATRKIPRLVALPDMLDRKRINHLKLYLSPTSTIIVVI